MSGTYVKVFSSILNSSVWCADVETRVVWIVLLLLADGEGCVWGAVPGIARQAGVDVAACRKAIELLSSPDPDSRTSEEEGRRIIPIDGGWRIVNHRKYREMQTNGQRKASERSRRYRERHRDRDVTQRDDHDASRSSRTEEEGREKSERDNGTPPTTVAGFASARPPRGAQSPHASGASDPAVVEVDDDDDGGSPPEAQW